MDVPEVGRELGQLALDVAALAIPADEGPRRESMPQVVEPRSVAVVMPAVRRTQAEDARDDDEVVAGGELLDAGAALGEEERRRCRAGGIWSLVLRRGVDMAPAL